MTAKAKVIRASRTPDGIIGYTLEIEHHSIAHPEFLTHREFSRNSSSTRALPIKRLIADVRHNLATPIHWGAQQPGMQADREVQGWRRKIGQWLWRMSGLTACNVATVFDCLGFHKQVGNMVLWPYMHFKVVLTTTNLDNFMALRNHKDARPEVRQLAEEIFNAVVNCKVHILDHGDWHLPYIHDWEWEIYNVDDLIKGSVARCARVSYLNHDGTEPSIEKDIKLYERLVGSKPLHASPTEHQFTPDRTKIIDVREHGKRKFTSKRVWENPDLHGNLKGVIQYRKTLEGEWIHRYPDISREE